jgi:hypothetical protein
VIKYVERKTSARKKAGPIVRYEMMDSSNLKEGTMNNTTADRSESLVPATRLKEQRKVRNHLSGCRPSVPKTSREEVKSESAVGGGDERISRHRQQSGGGLRTPPEARAGEQGSEQTTHDSSMKANDVASDNVKLKPSGVTCYRKVECDKSETERIMCARGLQGLQPTGAYRSLQGPTGAYRVHNGQLSIMDSCPGSAWGPRNRCRQMTHDNAFGLFVILEIVILRARNYC